MLDPILEELRQIRYQIEKDCQDNPQILSEYLYRVQSQYSERLVRRSLQPALQIAPG